MNEEFIETVHEVMVETMKELIRMGKLDLHELAIVQAGYDKLTDKLFQRILQEAMNGS